MKKTIFLVTMIISLIFATGMANASYEDLFPNGDAYYSEWGTGGCEQHYQCIDESPVNTQDVVDSARENKKDTYYFEDPSFSNSSNITAVTLYYYGKNIGGVDRNIYPLVRIDSTNYFGSNQTFDGNWGYEYYTWTNNPATETGWTYEDIRALEAGMDSTNYHPGGAIAQVFARVTYS